MIEFKVDYLQFSAKVGSIRLPLEFGYSWDERSNNKFYRHMRRYENGLLRYDGNPNTDKSLIVMSGSVLESIKFDVSHFVRLDKFKPKYSRIDLAMTTDVPILDKIIACKDQVISNKFGNGMVISDMDYTPQTIYFGSLKKRGRKGIVRAYDKALQLNLDGVIRHRIEVEFRQNDADLAVKRLKTGDTIQSIMNSRFMIDSAWYRGMFGDNIATGRFKDEKNEEPEINRKINWIKKQVIPSLQWIIDYDRDNHTDYWGDILSMLK